MKAIIPLPRTHPTVSRTISGTQERISILPPSLEGTPTVDQLLSLFSDDTLVSVDPLDGLLEELMQDDILSDLLLPVEQEETTQVVVQPEWLLQDEEITCVSHRVCLQVYYHWSQAHIDIDMIPSFGWQSITFSPSGSEEFVGLLHVHGRLCQIWRTCDGFCAQPISKEK